MHQYLTAAEIAKDLGIPKRTVQNYCRIGFLPASITHYKNRRQYSINSDTYYKWKSEHFSGVAKNKISKYTRKTKDLTLEQIRDLKDDWLDWCATGKLNGRPISERTVEIYGYYFDAYINKLGKYPSKPIISVSNLRDVLGKIDVKSFSTKKNIYDSIISFAKYLVQTKREEREGFVPELKVIRPKRLFPPKNL